MPRTLEGLGPSSQSKKAEGEEEEEDGEEKGSDEKYLALRGFWGFQLRFSSLYIKFFALGAVSPARTLKGTSLPSCPASSLLTRGLCFSLC